MNQRNRLVRRGTTGTLTLLGIGSLLLVCFLIYLAVRLRPESTQSSPKDQSIVLYCAAGIAKPVQEVLEKYNSEFKTQIKIARTGGSGELAGQIKTEFATGIRHGADLYVTADQVLLEKAKSEGIVVETFDLALQRPVVAIRADQEWSFTSFESLAKSKTVKFGISSPRAAVGKLARKIAERDGFSRDLEDNKVTEFENVMTLAQALVAGSIDAALIWDTTVAQINQNSGAQNTLKIGCLADPRDEVKSQIGLGIISTSRNPTPALRLARYLTAPEKSKAIFARYGFTFLAGDSWEETPEIHLYCGSMFTPVIEESVRKFAEREGINLYPKWEGCGKLVTRMQLSNGKEQFPDAYFACDQMFLDKVKEHFREPIVVSENDIVIAVRRKAEVQVNKLEDLLGPRVRVGICDPEQSALGTLTKMMLNQYPFDGFYDRLTASSSVSVDVGPTLVSQLSAGGLDAAIVYRSNIKADKQALEDLRIVEIDSQAPYSVATQPWAVARATRFPNLMNRMFQWIQDDQNRIRFRELGFRVIAPPKNEQ